MTDQRSAYQQVTNTISSMFFFKVNGFMNIHRVDEVLIIISQTLNCNVLRGERIKSEGLISWLAAPSAAFS